MTLECKLCHGTGKQLKAGYIKACVDCLGNGIIEVEYVMDKSEQEEVVPSGLYPEQPPVEMVASTVPATQMNTTWGKSLWGLIKSKFQKQ